MYRGMHLGEGLEASECRVCGSAARLKKSFATDTTMVVCPTCGLYVSTIEADFHLENLRPTLRNYTYKLSFAIRSASERYFMLPGKWFELTQEDIDKYLRAPDLSVQEKLRLLLQFLGSLSSFPGSEVRFNTAEDYSAISARNASEAEFYLMNLFRQGFIAFDQLPQDDKVKRCAVTAEGWLELERMEQSGATSDNCFVAMWFHPSRSEADAAITAAIKKAGYQPIRIDRVEHLNRIDDEIISRIRQSKFLVADFTGQRNGVYFEAGLMVGLGRPVIWVCQKNELEKVHFDTRQYNMIDYTDAADLERRLQLRIEANLGRGPLPYSATSASE